MRLSPSSPRLAGQSLLELAVSMSVLVVVLGAASSAFLALAGGTRHLSEELNSQSRLRSVRKALTEDLQMTDSLSVDVDGQPFIEISSSGGHASNVLTLRKPMGSGLVGQTYGLLYGDPVRYELEENGDLARVEGSSRRVLARHLTRSEFTLSPSGLVRLVVGGAGSPDPRAPTFETTFRFLPRNQLEI